MRGLIVRLLLTALSYETRSYPAYGITGDEQVL